MPALRRLLLTVAICFAAVLSSGALCQAQFESLRYEGANAQVIDFNRLPTAPLRYFAVLGDVERPGVYFTTERKVTRDRLLTRAGSHALARGYYRTYNSGLSNTSENVFDAVRSEAAHRDVIVVAGTKKSGASTSTADFYVAVIGLKTEPVVVRLPASQSSLHGLVALLKQPPEVAVKATVNSVKSTEPLKNGDVVLLDAQVVKRTTYLDDCDVILQPQPLDPPPLPAKATSAEAPVVEQQFAALPVLEAPVISSSPQPPAIEAVGPAPAPSGPATPTSVPPVYLAETPARQDLLQTQSPTPAPRVARQTASARQSVLNADYQTVAETVPAPSIRSLVILSALGTLGLGIALLWIASERRLRTAAMPAPVPIVERPAVQDPLSDEFADLIRGAVHVEDEPVVLPTKIALHGQSVGQKRLIVHPPEPLAGPHFGSVGSTENLGQSRPARVPVASESPTGPVRSPRDAEGLLDRVLLAMQREGRK